MPKIHPTAFVDPAAKIADDVEIGPLVSIEADVTVGEGTTIQQGAILRGHTTIGKNCRIYPYACVGMKTQDLKYISGSTSYVEIGDGTTLREFSTVHLGTFDGEKTIVGKNCLIMAYCHVAHGCVLGDHVITSNAVQLAGSVTIEDFGIIGGVTGVHQFCRIGTHAMVGGAAKVRRDIPPYMMCDEVDGEMRAVGPNIVGLSRRGFPQSVCRALKEAYRIIYREKLNRSQALDKIEREIEQTPEIAHLVKFYRDSTRGVC